ncbi:hypothetical protein ZHAS_00003354 [Anopheles sinensis]|uniref:Uncharacterized protein n=1 Tax=Anopheles sinensis TaxID=74873 RepID=A0A084VE26_ANOSI|nr:hypothetical protein ZHAS_00003354 [Anopheles sinensis]
MQTGGRRNATTLASTALPVPSGSCPSVPFPPEGTPVSKLPEQEQEQQQQAAAAYETIRHGRK